MYSHLQLVMQLVLSASHFDVPLRIRTPSVGFCKLDSTVYTLSCLTSIGLRSRSPGPYCISVFHTSPLGNIGCTSFVHNFRTTNAHDHAFCSSHVAHLGFARFRSCVFSTCIIVRIQRAYDLATSSRRSPGLIQLSFAGIAPGLDQPSLALAQPRFQHSPSVPALALHTPHVQRHG